MSNYLKELREKSKNLKPVLRIGKFGLNENIYNEVEKLLNKRHLIKIKILNNCPIEKDLVIEKILNKSNSVLVSAIGNVFSIYRR